MKENGVAIYLAIVIMFVLLGIGLGLSTILIGQIRMMKGMGDSVVAFYAADTGIERELYESKTGGEKAIGTTYSDFLDLDSDGGGVTDCPADLSDADDACYRVTIPPIWSVQNPTAGQFVDGGTSGISGVGWTTATVAFNGELYFGTGTPNIAEVYKYDGSIFTKVSQPVPGTIAAGGTADIDGIGTMAIYNGSLYVGTRKSINEAEVYRYDGGTDWTKVSQPVPGTIAAGGTTDIGGIGTMAIYNGSLYVMAGKIGEAEVYSCTLCDGTDWTKVSQPVPGTIAAGGTADIDGVYAMAIYNGSLYVGTRKIIGEAEVYRYDGGTDWTKVSQPVPGTIAAGGTTDIDGIGTMAIYNGSLYVGTRKIIGEAEVYRYDGGTDWTKVSQPVPGTIAAGGTTGIQDAISSAIYKGSLYVGTLKVNQAEVYSCTLCDGTDWTKVSQPVPGTITAGGTTDIDGVVSMAIYKGSLYVGTLNVLGAGAEIYKLPYTIQSVGVYKGVRRAIEIEL